MHFARRRARFNGSLLFGLFNQTCRNPNTIDILPSEEAWDDCFLSLMTLYIAHSYAFPFIPLFLDGTETLKWKSSFAGYQGKSFFFHFPGGVIEMHLERRVAAERFMRDEPRVHYVCKCIYLTRVDVCVSPVHYWKSSGVGVRVLAGVRVMRTAVLKVCQLLAIVMKYVRYRSEMTVLWSSPGPKRWTHADLR